MTSQGGRSKNVTLALSHVPSLGWRQVFRHFVCVPSSGHQQNGEENNVTHVLIIVSWLGVANGAVISTQEFTSAERCNAARLALIEYAKAPSSNETLRPISKSERTPSP